MKNLGFYWTAFSAALQSKFEYRVDFLLGIVTACMMQLSSLAFVWVIFHQTQGLNGWTADEVIFLFGMAGAALGFSELFFNHIWSVPGYIVTGDLDRLLTYPVNSLYFLLITRPELHAFGNLVTGLTIASVALAHLNAPWYTWILLPFFAFCGCLIYTAALVIFASISFKFVGPSPLHLMIPHALLNATRYPISIYPFLVQLLLLFFIPYGAFHYLPAGLFLQKALSPWTILICPLSALLFFWEAGVAWRWGINQYESTGS